MVMRYEPDVSSGATEGSLATSCALCTCGCFLLSRWRISASIVLLIISFSRSADNYPSTSGNPNLYALSWSLFATTKYTFHLLFLWVFIATSAIFVALLRSRFFRLNDVRWLSYFTNWWWDPLTLQRIQPSCLRRFMIFVGFHSTRAAVSTYPKKEQFNVQNITQI